MPLGSALVLVVVIIFSRCCIVAHMVCMLLSYLQVIFVLELAVSSGCCLDMGLPVLHVDLTPLNTTRRLCFCLHSLVSVVTVASLPAVILISTRVLFAV
jgi:hypothetical protein